MNINNIGASCSIARITLCTHTTEKNVHLRDFGFRRFLLECNKLHSVWSPFGTTALSGTGNAADYVLREEIFCDLCKQFCECASQKKPYYRLGNGYWFSDAFEAFIIQYFLHNFIILFYVIQSAAHLCVCTANCNTFMYTCLERADRFATMARLFVGCNCNNNISRTHIVCVNVRVAQRKSIAYI